MFPEFLSSQIINLPIPQWLIILIIIWVLVWKGFALWRAARLNHMIWFLLILVINTFGVLEIIYLLFSKHSAENKIKEDEIKTKTNQKIKKS